MSTTECDAAYYVEGLKEHIAKSGGRYILDESGIFNLIMNGRRIPIQHGENYLLAGLLLEVCDMTLTTAVARAVVQRLQIEAASNLGNVKFRRFSALSEDQKRLYIPVGCGQLMQISADGIELVENGYNADELWIEHPYAEPFIESDPSDGFELFEELLVGTQAVAVESMRWFVAMNEGLFCCLRDIAPARFLTVHIGPSQSGKTTGTQRFTYLHGLGEVKGDYTVAALNNEGDSGLLVLDNKEQANFSQDLIDFLLFVSTGGKRGRSHSDGRMRLSPAGRPLGVITTIEGVVKPELQLRCVDVHYERQQKTLSRAGIEFQIKTNRHKILSAFALVFTRFFEIRGQATSPDPISLFGEHFGTLCDLLRAYGDVASKPNDWSEEIIADWDRTIRSKEPEEDDLEHPIKRVIEANSRQPEGHRLKVQQIQYQERKGTLYITEPGHLLTLLQELNIKDLALPKNSSGLGRRLRSSTFRQFTFLETDTPGVERLKRRDNNRPIGFFVPKEG